MMTFSYYPPTLVNDWHEKDEELVLSIIKVILKQNNNVGAKLRILQRLEMILLHITATEFKMTTASEFQSSGQMSCEGIGYH